MVARQDHSGGAPARANDIAVRAPGIYRRVFELVEEIEAAGDEAWSEQLEETFAV